MRGLAAKNEDAYSAWHRRTFPSAAAAAACWLATVLCLFSMPSCGAAPREIELNPGPPAYPPSFFTPDLPPPQLIGAPPQRLETTREQLVEAEARRPDKILFIEYFSNHPYVLAAHYVLSLDENRVERLEYELTPQILTDLGTRMALFGDLVAAYGEPEERSAFEWVWTFDNYELRWRGVILQVTRQRVDPS